MAMTFTYHEYADFGGNSDYLESSRRSKAKTICAEKIHLFAEKMEIPDFNGNISRPRLTKLIESSLKQFGATLICGRAGTGKTALAAEFAAKFERVAWLKIDVTETDWHLFACYIIEIFDEDFRDYEKILNGSLREGETISEQIPVFIESLVARIAAKSDAPQMIVLDDIHNIFDAEWFAEFFVDLLYASAPHIRLLMLTRAKPPQPLWRLRSKQVLGVVDEKVLTPDSGEIENFLKKSKVSVKLAAIAGCEARGKISALKNFVDSL